MGDRSAPDASESPACARSRISWWNLVFLGAIFLMRGEQPLTAIPCRFRRQILRLLVLRFAGLEGDGKASSTPATAGAPANRMSATTEMDLGDTRTIASELGSVGASVLVFPEFTRVGVHSVTVSLEITFRKQQRKAWELVGRVSAVVLEV